VTSETGQAGAPTMRAAIGLARWRGFDGWSARRAQRLCTGDARALTRRAAGAHHTRQRAVAPPPWRPPGAPFPAWGNGKGKQAYPAPLRIRAMNHVVIPGRPAGAGPESIFQSRGYGFRARAIASKTRVNALMARPGMTISFFRPANSAADEIRCLLRVVPWRPWAWLRHRSSDARSRRSASCALLREISGRHCRRSW
jgi:hypothetical protein